MTDRTTIEAYESQAALYSQHLGQAELSPLHAFYEKPATHQLLGDVQGKRVLSLGCGDGADMDDLMKSDPAAVVGVDISQGLVAEGLANNPARNMAVMDMAVLGFNDASFDVAYSSLAMHYLVDWEKPLAEAWRVLADDGRFVFSCYHPLETALELRTGRDERTALIGRRINSNDESREVYGDYMAVAQGGVKRIEREIADSVPVTLFHRTLSVMATSILRAGFRIERIVEPVPDKEMAVDNEEIFKQVNRMPKFIIWALTKQ